MANITVYPWTIVRKGFINEHDSLSPLSPKQSYDDYNGENEKIANEKQRQQHKKHQQHHHKIQQQQQQNRQLNLKSSHRKAEPLVDISVHPWTLSIDSIKKNDLISLKQSYDDYNDENEKITNEKQRPLQLKQHRHWHRQQQKQHEKTKSLNKELEPLQDVTIYPWTIVPKESSSKNGPSLEQRYNEVNNNNEKIEMKPNEKQPQQQHQQRKIVSRNRGVEPLSPCNLRNEFRLLLSIALPTVASQFFSFLIFPLAAASLSHYLPSQPSSSPLFMSNSISNREEALAAFSLATLSGNVACTATIFGILNASETLQPRAFGLKNFRDVGIIAIRSLVVCTLILLPILFFLCTHLDFLLETLGGQDDRISEMAILWIRRYALGVPCLVVFRVVQRFLACQNVVAPCLYGSAFGCILVHPMLLRLLVPVWGFDGSAMAIACTQLVQASSTIGCMVWMDESYLEETWPRFDKNLIKEAVDPMGLWNYVKLSLGGMLSLSEWWFWESICFIAGKLGVIPLCVHTIAYQIIPILFMIPLGIGIGLSVRIGNVLPQDITRAKRLATYAVLFTGVLGITVAAALYRYQSLIVSFFTTDEVIIAGCDAIWGKVSIFVFFLFLVGINGGILRALGLQWRMAATMILVLWFGTLPVLVHVCLWGGGGLDMMWSILPLAYAALDVGLALCYVFADWSAISKEICEKARIATTTFVKVDSSNNAGTWINAVNNEQTILLGSISNKNKRLVQNLTQ